MWSGNASYCIFYCTFGLTQKYQKVKHGEKLRAPVAACGAQQRTSELCLRSFGIAARCRQFAAAPSGGLQLAGLVHVAPTSVNRTPPQLVQ